MIEYVGQPYLRNWMLERNNIEYTSGLICLGNRNSNGQIMGVVGYDNWTGKSCVMHVVGSPGWLTKSFMWAAFDYPFNQAKCDVIFAKIPTANEFVVNLTVKLGFKFVCTVQDVFPDGGETILKMYKHQCKWLEVNHGWII
jgi:RimJ/RimL family protein N-acetyltransferase